MKNILFALAVLFGLSCSAQVEASYWGCDPCYITHCVAYEARTVTCYRPEWREEKVDVTVHRMQCKEVVDKVKVTVMVPNWVDEKRTYTVCRYEPKSVVRDVVRCHYVAACAFDPCTGCPIMSYQPVTRVEKVACTVYEPKTEEQTVTVKVCRMVSQEQVIECRRLEWSSVPETQTVVRRYCVSVPYQAVVHVPVHVSCCGR